MKDFIKKYIVALCAVAVMASCNKDMEEIIDLPKVDVEDPTVRGPLEFDVRVDENSTFKVGDTVKFILEGNAEMVNFYSGAVGNDYAYRETERFYEIMANLSFQSGKAPANGSVSNYDCAQLVYSTDFNGDRSSANAYNNVKSATWTNITNRFSLPTIPGNIADYVNSGVSNISDIFEEGKPVYLAWHCTTQAASSRVQFRVIEFSLQGVVVDNPSLSSQLYTQNGFGFQWVLNEAAAEQPSNLPTVTSTQLQWSGIFNNNTTNTTAGQTHPLIGQFKEGYAISGPLELPQFNAGKDMPTVLIMKQNANVLEHKYVYDRAGEYEVVFIASGLNSGSGTQEEIIKKITITIEE